MTIRTLYKPTRLSTPLPRGWLIVPAAALAWLALILAVCGVVSALSWIVGLLP